MAQWLSHPNEFGEKPSKIETFYSELSYWPFSKEKEQLYFHKFTMPDGSTHVGMTGPITFSLFGVNHDQFTKAELIRIYAGWYTVFALKSNGNHDQKMEEEICSSLTAQLLVQGFTTLSCDNLSFGDMKYSAVKVTQEKTGGNTILFAYDKTPDTTAKAELDFSNLPPLYYYLGHELMRE
jgi:hypothetical protein